MLDRFIVGALAVSAFLLVACGATSAQVNNAGHEAYMGGDYETALESYLDAQEQAAASGEPYYNVANVLYRMGRYEDSLEGYDESIRHATGELRARGFFNRGNASFQQQRYTEAVEAYEEVLRIDPDDGDAKHNLELALKQLSAGQQDQEDEQQAGGREQEQDEQQAGGQEQEQDEQQAGGQEQEQDEQQAREQEQERDEQQAREQEQERDAAEAQARRLLESVGESAQTLQERRGQALVSPRPPSEFDW